MFCKMMKLIFINYRFLQDDSLLLKIILNFSNMKQSQEARQRKFQQQVAKFRQAFPPTVSNFTRFISFVKNVGGQIMSHLSNVYNRFKNSQNKPSESSAMLQQKKEEKGEAQTNRKGKILNFNDFNYTNLQEQQQSQQKRLSLLNKRGINFQFKPEKIKDQSDDLDVFRYSKNRKKVKTVYEDNSYTIQEILKRGPREKIRRLNQIQNQVTYDRVQILLQAREIRLKEEANEPKPTLQQKYQKYLKSLGIENQKDGTKGNHTKLCEMMKKSKNLVERRPPRKKRHVENDIPPILCLQKVMQVLETQRQQAFSDKKKRLSEEQAYNMQNEGEVQKQDDAKIQELKQLNTKAYQEVKKQQNKERIALTPINEEPDAQSAIKQNPQQKQDQHPNVPAQHVPKHIQKPALYESPPDQKQIQQIQEGFQTPPKKETAQQRQNRLLGNSNELNKSNKSNPFTNKNVSPVSLQELMKKQPNLMFPQIQIPPMPQSTVGSTFFPQNTQVPNLFSTMPSQNQIIPQINFNQKNISKYSSPTNFMSNPIQKSSKQSLFFPSNPKQANILYKNGSGTHEVSPFLQQQNTVLSGQSGYASDSPFYGNLHTYNPGAAKIFDLNLFAANNPAPTSLFGSANQQKIKQPPARRKNKHQIRIN